MCYVVIKHNGHLRTQAADKCFLHFSSVLKCPECNTWLKLLHLLYYIEVIKYVFLYVLYSDLTWVFDQLKCAQGPIYYGE